MARKFYGPANNAATLATDLYGGSSNGAQRTTKLYGSVNNQAKLIHQGFGHVDYGYGVVEYYTDSGHTGISYATISNLTEFASLSNGSAGAWTATVGGMTISGTDIKGVFLTEKVTSIANNFLRRALALTSLDITRCQLTSIGHSFLEGCNNFNQSIKLPSTLTSLGGWFMFGCLRMSNTVDIGALNATIAAESDYTLSQTNGTSYPMYASGVKVAGPNRAAWLARFPNRSSSPYRNLVDAGY